MGMQYYPVIHLQPNGPLFLGGLTFNFMGWIFQNMGLRVSRHWIRIPSWTNRRNGMSPKYFMESIKFFVFFSWLRYQILSNRVGGGPPFSPGGKPTNPQNCPRHGPASVVDPEIFVPVESTWEWRPLDRWPTDDPWGAEGFLWWRVGLVGFF